MLTFTNVIFFVKYGSRVLDGGYLYLAGIAYALVYVSLLTNPRLGKLTSRFSSTLFYSSVVALVSTIVFAQLFVDPLTLNVDRWSVISSFLEKGLNNQYPYGAISHLGNPPGPMPVYFILAFPFYIVGGLCVLSGLGYLATLSFLRRFDHENSGKYYLSLLLSPCVYWEIATRSNVMTYSVLVLMGLTFFNLLDKTHWSRKLALSAVSVGLLLATRSVFIIAYMIYSVANFQPRKAILHVKYWGLAVCAFASAFLPLILIWPDEFWTINPFIVQSEYLMPRWIILSYLLFIGTVVLFAKFKDSPFYSGLFLFLLIGIYSTYLIFTVGFQTAFFDSKIDISYFIFSVPFLYLSLANSVKNKISASENTVTPA